MHRARLVFACTLIATGCAAPAERPPADAVAAARPDAACDSPRAIEHGGKRRFLSGVNLPWNRFGADFGGQSRSGQDGLAGSARIYEAVLADMRAHGAYVVRWWVLPDFSGDGVVFDTHGLPVGLGGTIVADLHKALELADKTDVDLMLCLFSFDGFAPRHEESGAWIESLAPIVRDPARRKALIDTVVRPLARAAQASEHRDRLLSWDVINEPEWAIHGTNPHGDPAYTPMSDLDTVDHAQMKAFVRETVVALREETPDARITVGSAGAKWARAWQSVGLDFYQLHWYDWLNASWPHDRTPESYGLGDKPVVVGEFPVGGMAGKDLGALMETWYEEGYAGALGWAYDQMSDAELAELKAFSEARGDPAPCANVAACASP